MEIQQIRSFPPFLSNEKDFLIWQPNPNGEFSIKSAVLRRRHQGASLLSRTLIWDQRLPRKISIFMWRLLNALLPLPDILSKFGFHLPSKCVFCNHVETLEHVFLTCEVATAVWHRLGLLLHFRTDRADEILMQLQNWWMHSSGNGFVANCYRLLPALICWALWKFRNLAYFEGVVTPVHVIFNHIVKELQLIARATPFTCSTPEDKRCWTQGLVPFLKQPPRARLRIIRWMVPPMGYVKLNVDGSSLGNPGDAGGGGLIRDSEGRLLYGFSTFYGWQTNMSAEAMALLEGLQLCKSHGFPHVEIEIDSLTLLKVVRREMKCPWRIWGVVCHIRHLLEDFTSVLHHCYRELNAVADSLAKLASTSRASSSYCATSFPRDIRGLLQLDRVSYPYIRRQWKP